MILAAESNPVADWFTAMYESNPTLFRIVLLLVVAAVVRWVLSFTIRRVVHGVVHGVKKSQNVDQTVELNSSPLIAVRLVQRTRTMGTVLNNLVTWVIVIVTSMLLLGELGFEVTGLIASAGIIGAALGFGAQNVIKDILNGLFMVFEDQLGVGDVVDLGSATGVVEEVAIRVTKVRDVNGTLWFVRNGEILRVGNMSQGWARVVIDLPAPYASDVNAIEETLLAVAQELADDPEWRRKILEDPEIWGIESISAEAVVMRLVLKVRSSEQWDVARELRKRLKATLDEKGIVLPALNRVVFDGLDSLVRTAHVDTGSPGE
ncbi:MAG: mechanosensitive ion channel family protein [Microbacteriaceae bacterium]